MIMFQDFIPQRQGKRLLGMVSDYENLHELVGRVNRWIEQNAIDVMNVETVLLTQLPKDTEESLNTQITSQVNVISVYQIVRVWYRSNTPERETAYTGQTTRLSTE